jgi:hypothetical protein
MTEEYKTSKDAIDGMEVFGKNSTGAVVTAKTSSNGTTQGYDVGIELQLTDNLLKKYGKDFPLVTGDNRIVTIFNEHIGTATPKVANNVFGKLNDEHRNRVPLNDSNSQYHGQTMHEEKYAVNVVRGGENIVETRYRQVGGEYLFKPKAIGQLKNLVRVITQREKRGLNAQALVEVAQKNGFTFSEASFTRDTVGLKGSRPNEVAKAKADSDRQKQNEQKGIDAAAVIDAMAELAA